MTERILNGHGQRFMRKVRAREAKQSPWAVTGYYRADGTPTGTGDDDHDDVAPVNQMWVRWNGLASDVKLVWATDFNRDQINAYVWLKKRRKGGWQIDGLMDEEMAANFGEQASQATLPAVFMDQNPKTIVSPINLDMGKPRGLGGLSLTFDRFTYTSINDGKQYTFDPDANPDVLLTLTPPAQVSSTDQRAYLRASFNCDDAAPAFNQTPGASVNDELDLYLADADAIDTPVGDLPLWDFIVSTSDTVLKPYTALNGLDRRPWFSGQVSGGGSVIVPDATTTVVGGVLIDQSPISGSPIALTAGNVRDANGVAMLGGDRRVPSFELPPGPTVSVSETSRWTRYGVTLAASVAWEQSVLQEPNVFYEDGTWTMFYTGGYANPAIGRATSTDGKVWTKYASNPILGQGVGGVAGFVAHTGVIKHQGTWYLYFSNGTTNPDLAYATSPDGITWTYQGIAIAHNQETWSANWFNSTIWVEDGNQWKMLVEGKASGGVYFITLATATDPAGPWTFPTGGALTTLEVFAGGGYSGPMMPVPQRVGGLYVLWYHAVGTTTGVLPTELYRATSPNLITWTRYSHNPILSPSGVSPEIDQTADPDVHEVNGVSYLFYEGFDNVTPVAGIKLLTYAGPLAALVREEGLPAYLDANSKIPVVNLPVATSSTPGIVQPDNSSITILAGVLSATPATGTDHVHGLARWTGDGSTTAFELPDIAEYLELVFNAGSAVDPALVSLSSDGSQVAFSTAPTAANVLQATYVLARIT